MRCQLCCKENGLLIRGRCVKCAPTLHGVRQHQANLMAELEDRYRARTGKGSLDDWTAFENFLDNQLTPEQQDTIERAFLGPCLW